MRLALVILFALTTACVPRAAHRRTVNELQQARAASATQQAEVASLRAQVASLEARCGAAAAKGPPAVQASTLAALDLRVPSLMALPFQQQAAAMAALNSTVGPCGPCVAEGASAATCLLRHPECANMPGLTERVARLATRGLDQAALAEALRYDHPWQAVAVGDAPVRGGDRAVVTVVMFMEAQCPFCKRASATMDELAQRYGDRLRFVYKHMPLAFHDKARPAALAMEAARRQGRFWEYHDALYARAGELRSNDALLDELATGVGLDLGRFHHDLADPALEARVAADQAQAASLGISGTPSFSVNGYPVRGAQPIENFASLIDRELDD